MRIEDPDLLHEFRCKDRCEYCGKLVRTGLDPAHVFSRGAGRLDIRINLVALDRICHIANHNGKSPTRDDLLQIVARREGLTVEEIIDEIFRLRRLPKGSSM